MRLYATVTLRQKVLASQERLEPFLPLSDSKNKRYEAVTPQGVTAPLAQPSRRAPLLRYLVGFDSDTLCVKEILDRDHLDGLGAVALVREEGALERPISW